MRVSILRYAGVLFLLLLMTGCVARGPAKSTQPFQPVKIDAERYESKVDAFLVIFDGSSSMGERSGGMEKFATATEFVKRMNQTLPELGQTAGFRSFGHDKSVSKWNTELFSGMEDYSTAGLAGGLDKVHTTGGTSPIHKALEEAGSDFEGISGEKAVIIVSDGEEPYMMHDNALAQAQALKESHGSSICVYTIHVGDSQPGKDVMARLAESGKCGFSADAENLMSGEKMADFVKTVFLSEKSEPEPEPEKSPVVKKEKEPVKKPERKDSDQDGVYDDKDKCPGTPLGAEVNFRGCWTIAGYLFDFDKAAIKPKARDRLDNIYNILTKNPDLTIILKGHTDSTGPEAYNKDLSLKRAQAVQKVLVDRGISADRIGVRGLGENEPLASNSTESGRALNRRVEIEPIY